MIRYQADNDVRREIIVGLLRLAPEVDLRTAQDRSLDGVPDLEVLALAAHDNRVLISHDFKTMPRHFKEFTRQTNSPGVFLIPQRLPIGQAVDSLHLVWSTSLAKEWEDRLILIPSLITMAVGRQNG